MTNGSDFDPKLRPIPPTLPNTYPKHIQPAVAAALSSSEPSKQDPNRIPTPMGPNNPNTHPFQTHLVSTADSPEFSLLQWALCRSSVVALDAEWKPTRSGSGSGSEVKPAASPSFPTVTLLQIACRVRRLPSDPICGDSPVFLVDLISIPLSSIWEILRDMFISASILKLGFRFKQDLVYLSSTFESLGGFDKVEPFFDITSVYHHLRNPKVGKKFPKESKSLATICEEILNISLSKELQCSDWSFRPLTEEQISYAAADAYYLLEIFAVFECSFDTEGKMSSNLTEIDSSSSAIGLKEILMPAGSNICRNILMSKFCEASDMVKSSTSKTDICTMIMSNPQILQRITSPRDKCISNIVKNHGERLQLKEADQKPRAPRRKGRRQSANANCGEKLECNGVWQGLPQWDLSLGGDGCPKFLCDVMVEGLARHLRCVGIDAAIPSVKKPEPRQLLDQAYKEKRVILTRDVKLLRHQYSIRNQVYRVKNLLKNDQLLEVIEAFQLKISEDQLMSRCTKCNGSFIQKPLTMEEAIEASKGFQVIPNCLFNRNIEFWQCTDCHQLYWEGTQYHNAVQKFVTVCKLND